MSGVFNKAWLGYQQQLLKNPTITKILTSFGLFSAADVVC